MAASQFPGKDNTTL